MLAAVATVFQRAASRAIRTRYCSGMVLRGVTAIEALAEAINSVAVPLPASL